MGVGAWSYVQLTQTLSRDVVEFTVLLVSVLLSIVTVDLGAVIDASMVRRKWLWLFIPYALSLYLYSTVVRAVIKLGQSPTHELGVQFGLRTVAFFFLLSVWILVVPIRPSSQANTSLRKLHLALAVVVGLIQTILGTHFLRELWLAASVDQVRTSMRSLIYVGLTLYLFLVVKLLLPRTISDLAALSAKNQSP
jgi:hypothetical protein